MLYPSLCVYKAERAGSLDEAPSVFGPSLDHDQRREMAVRVVIGDKSALRSLAWMWRKLGLKDLTHIGARIVQISYP